MHGEVCSEIRVLHVVENFHGQAVESWLTRLVEFGWRGSRINCSFFLIGNAPGRDAAKIEEAGCEIFEGNCDSGSLYDIARALRSVVKTGRFDIVHIHQDVLAGVFAAFLVGIDVRIITHVHNCWQRLPVGGRFKEPVLRTIARYLTLFLSDAIVGVSGQALSKMVGHVRRRRRIDQVIHCSIKQAEGSVEVFPQSERSLRFKVRHGIPAESKLLLFLGRLDEYKNPVFALCVLEQIVAQNEDLVHLVIAGTGGLELTLSELVRKKGLSNRVRMLGWVDNPLDLMTVCDLLLVPSQEWCGEGLGLAAVEAQSCGLRVLCSTSIPREAMIVPSGLCVKPLGDGALEWGRKALDLLAKERLSVEQGISALSASTFTTRASLESLERLYLKVLSTTYKA